MHVNMEAKMAPVYYGIMSVDRSRKLLCYVRILAARSRPTVA